MLRGPDGKEMGMLGVYRELTPPERSVQLESFDDYPGESRVTLFSSSRAVFYPSREVRDAVLKSGMEHGAAESYDKLAELLSPAEGRTIGERSSVLIQHFGCQEIRETTPDRRTCQWRAS